LPPLLPIKSYFAAEYTVGTSNWLLTFNRRETTTVCLNGPADRRESRSWSISTRAVQDAVETRPPELPRRIPDRSFCVVPPIYMTAARNIEAISAVQTVTASEQNATINTSISGLPPARHDHLFEARWIAGSPPFECGQREAPMPREVLDALLLLIDQRWQRPHGKAVQLQCGSAAGVRHVASAA
jgi:hypothetical protein